MYSRANECDARQPKSKTDGWEERVRENEFRARTEKRNVENRYKLKRLSLLRAYVVLSCRSRRCYSHGDRDDDGTDAIRTKTIKTFHAHSVRNTRDGAALTRKRVLRQRV